MSERASQAIQAWAQALSQPLEVARFQAAIGPDAQVRRHGWGTRIAGFTPTAGDRQCTRFAKSEYPQAREEQK